MSRSTREVEVKLRFDSAEQARSRFEPLGLRLAQARHFEDNVVYDREHEPLVAAGKLLRLRTRGDTSIVTYKAPIAGTHRHKVREEHESIVLDAGAVERILAGLGFRPVYRYQKYRTLYEREGLHLCLDETPIGCFVELEGSPGAIDRAARELGVAPDEYVLLTYRELHERDARERGVEPGDLVFDGGAGNRR
ncbi:MAG TPA: class IV adenylate cyclase [Candidatus Polarisedimenticolaceae bacterium]|nr:class IV adenylate cyclase [Candidatus Polarisedimenticolaceae bacterium]